MTKKKSTKRALLMSGLAILVCFTMLVGTTFAWFTDSVTSGRNQIVAGNLSVQLEYKTPTTDWAEVNADTVLFSENNLWEPGHTEVVAFRVKNTGSLALKYDLATTVFSEIEGINKDGGTITLSKILKVYADVVDDDAAVTAALANRTTATSGTESALGENVIPKDSVLLKSGDEAYAVLQ